MMQEKRWHIAEVDENLVNELQNALNINRKLCQLLVLRGIHDFEEAKSFFRPDLKNLNDPFLMKDMRKAVDRILSALRNNEEVMVYGDYDVDGTTSVAVLYSFLKKNYSQSKIHYYIPHRFKEGYGVSFLGIDKAIELNCSLIITIDCGITSVEQTAYAKEKDIDVIICDHHLPGNELPAALAILNPKQSDCSYPYKELSGCGIGMKLITAIAQTEGLSDETWKAYLGLAATSIAADIVSMDGENRIMTYWGLEKINNNPSPGIKAIKVISGKNGTFSSTDLVFVIAPRVNAAGRMNEAKAALEVFLAEDSQKALEHAKILDQLNMERRTVGQTMVEEALRMIGESEDLKQRRSTVLYNPHWHKGIVGIVASKIQDNYYRPTIILTESNGKITGSARSVIGFNIHHALEQCADCLEQFGGHFFAAGMTLLPENLKKFQERFEEVVSAELPRESRTPQIDIEAELDFSEITPSFFKILKQFEPFGPANLPPIFISKRVRGVQDYSRTVKDKHIRFVVQQEDGASIAGIGFNLADKFDIVASGKPFDLVYTLHENVWKGRVDIQLEVKDLRPSAS